LLPAYRPRHGRAEVGELTMLEHDQVCRRCQLLDEGDSDKPDHTKSKTVEPRASVG
jgi:hypothetical protein